MFKEWMLNSTQTIDRAFIRSVHNIKPKKTDLLVWNLKYVWLIFAFFEIIIKPPQFGTGNRNIYSIFQFVS